MRLNALLPRQNDNCITCPDPPPCACSADQDCFQINRDCFTCATFRCVAKQGSSSSPKKGGASKGALAGGIVGALLFLAFAIALFLWYRRRNNIRSINARRVEAKPDIPAPAEAVLKRPDPNAEKSLPSPTDHNNVRVYSTSDNTTIDLDPESQHSAPDGFSPTSPRTNPFDDTHSIQTAITEGTNVIPIALVTPADSNLNRSQSQSTTSTNGPMRPMRSPDLNLNLEHVNVSHDSIRPANYALSQRSGLSGVSDASSRNSFLSSASYSSDFLNEAPMIITPNKGAVRQVLGVVKAEVVSSDTLRPSTVMSRPSVRSPLASTSFGPGDISGSDEGHGGDNPFSDRHVSTNTTMASSPTTTAFGGIRQSSASTVSEFGGENGSLLPWHRDSGTRPSSMDTQAGTVIGIETATRVNVGLSSPLSANAVRSPNRTTMARLMTPSTGEMGTFEQQQQRALAHAQARAEAEGLNQRRRQSGSSVLSATSTRADSILESFPFVPPSPISNRPLRTPPVSPLRQQTFEGSPTSPLSKQSFNGNANDIEIKVEGNADDSDLPQPPSRNTLGMSTASQFSNASTGLGSFAFDIDGRNSTTMDTSPPTPYGARQRASLDTLAITSDLSSYPLGFDRDSGVPPFKKN